MLFAYILSIGRIFKLYFCSCWVCLSLHRFVYLLCYIALYNVILKVYFFVFDSTGNNSFSTHKFHLMVNTAKILVHPYEK